MLKKVSPKNKCYNYTLIEMSLKCQKPGVLSQKIPAVVKTLLSQSPPISNNKILSCKHCLI